LRLKTGKDSTVEKTGLLLIGLGQELRSDDGAGIAAVRSWQAEYPQTAAHPLVRVALLNTPGLSLLDMLEGVQFALIVDAIRSDKSPGAVSIVEEAQLESFIDGTGTAHGFGVAETLNLGRALEPEKLPERLILLGIEAGDLSLGQGLTRDVEAALPIAARSIQELVCQFLAGS
jgi:hydrogenase maturation protease